MRDVALITCRELPEPDPDEAPLLEALGAAGLDAALVPWDDPAAIPEAYALCVLRSCWNYYADAPGFLAWVERVDAATRLLNPAPIVRWNVHKRYLQVLAAANVPVVPTEWVGPGDRVDLRRTCAARGWRELVIKPAVAAASFGARRFGPDALAEAEAHVGVHLAACDVMIQPYLSSVEMPGERALVWIDGALTHAVRKHPRFAGGDEHVGLAAPPSAAERELATRALEVARDAVREESGAPAGELLYARVDVVQGAGGEPLVSELELVEPSLFLMQNAGARDRLVRAIVRLCAENGPRPPRAGGP